MTSTDPYHTYVEGGLFGGNPLEMVIALYEGALEAIRGARRCLAENDIWGRAKAISKAVAVLTELLVSLDHQQGGEISANLKRLYSYLQRRLLEAHAKRADEPLQEAERLLSTMLDGWRCATRKTDPVPPSARTSPACVEVPRRADDTVWGYGFLADETPLADGSLSEVF